MAEQTTQGVGGQGAQAAAMLSWNLDAGWQQLADQLDEPLLTVGIDGRLEHVSAPIKRCLGFSREAFQQLFNQTQEAGQDRRLQCLQEAIERHLRLLTPSVMGVAAPPKEPIQLERSDGTVVHCELQCFPQPAGGLMCLLRVREAAKQHQRVDIEPKLAGVEASQALAAKVFENSLTGIYITDLQGNIVQVNHAFSRMTEYAAAEVLGQSPQCMDVERYSAAYFKSISDSLERKDSWEGEIQHRRKGGQVFPAWVSITVLRDDSGAIINTISHFTDVTEKKNSDNKIHRLAYVDPLTGLPNRSLFADRFAQALSRAKRQNNMVALLFLDLDRFKAVNDSLGHALGDSLLQQAGQRLRDCVRTDDTIARMGGDEFTVVLGDLKDRTSAMTAAAHIAEKIRHVMHEPFIIGERKVFTGASIGIAFYPNDGAEPQTLLQHADNAMYHAKSKGKNNYQFYTNSLNTRAREHLVLEQDLRQALERSQFELYYQPILSAEEGEAVAVEALVRWNHPERGMIMPNDFIALAEELGLMRSLGSWVLREACGQLASWREQGAPIKRVTINISAKQFNEGHVVSSLREVMEQANIDPACIELELTEAALMENEQFALESLEEIKRLGVGVALDDFGSGYSSMRYLKYFPIDTLKIDRRFISALPTKEDQQIVQAIVALGKHLKMKIVAVGVENPLQLEFVQTLGCDEVQGFMLSQPMPVQQLVF